MKDKAKKHDRVQTQNQVEPSPLQKPQSNLPKVDPSKTISYRQDGAAPK